MSARTADAALLMLPCLLQYETYLVCHPLTGMVPWLRLGSRHIREASMSAICTR